MKILIIEDDIKTAKLLEKGLKEEGFSVSVCIDGAMGLEEALTDTHDLIVLDVMLPNLDGWAVVSELRSRHLTVPILFITARDAIEQRVKGLSLGADDYLVKPFAFSGLVARIRTVLRRRNVRQQDASRFEELSCDLRRHKASRNGVEIDLSAKELMLLDLLLRHQGEVLSRTFIAEQVWDLNLDCDSNVIDVSIRRLRAKIEDPFDRKFIHTVRGRGYVLR